MNQLITLYIFNNPALQRQAFTHVSVGGEHNERLEWLGDALVDFLISQLLFEQHAKLNEGRLTQIRSQLVNGRTLADLARQIGVPEQLRLSPNESRNGGRMRESILAGALEAYIAAIYLDGGMAAAQKIIQQLFGEHLQNVVLKARDNMDKFKDNKSRLQEYLQKRGQALPKYELLAHGKTAQVEYCVARCQIESQVAVTAVAATRRDAEQEASGCILATLNV